MPKENELLEMLNTFLDTVIAMLRDNLMEILENAKAPNVTPSGYFSKVPTLESLASKFQTLYDKEEALNQQISKAHATIESKAATLESKAAPIAKKQQICNLYQALNEFITASKQPKSLENTVNLQSKFAGFIEAVMTAASYQFEHEQIQQILKDSTANSCVFIVGAGNNEQQNAPNFLENYALKGALICNIDQSSPYRQEKYPMSYFFPSTECQQMFPNTAINKKLESIIDAYVAILADKQQNNPEFKFVLLYCCDTFIDNYTKSFIKKLQEQGNFTLGANLQVVHTYEDGCPACVYNPGAKYLQFDPKKSTERNYSLEFGTESDVDDKHTTFYPNLYDVKIVFPPLHQANKLTQ